jgi:glycosyltransferase involved in cell wall biosynthesis
MGNNPLVSAIIIFLNMEQFLEEAIASVLVQTYTHWELLLVDDGSTDGSTAIALRYARTYPSRIRYLEHEEHQNRGMSASRNLGIHYSSGHYIGFLDADDVWLPHKLVEQVALLEASPQAAMIYGRTQIWYSWLAHPDHCRSDYFYDLGVAPDTLVAPPRLLTLLLQNRVQTPTTCNALIRREVVDAVGGFEEHFRGMYEDQAFFAKVELG